MGSQQLLKSPLKLCDLFRPANFLNALRQQAARTYRTSMDRHMTLMPCMHVLYMAPTGHQWTGINLLHELIHLLRSFVWLTERCDWRGSQVLRRVPGCRLVLVTSSDAGSLSQYVAMVVEGLLLQGAVLEAGKLKVPSLTDESPACLSS